MMWVIALAGALMFGSWLRGMARVVGGSGRATAESAADGVLFWGSFAFIAGLLGTIVGIYQAARAVEAAGAVSTSVLWGGFKMTLITTQFGLIVLLLSALLWFGLVRLSRRSRPGGYGEVQAVDEEIASLQRAVAMVQEEQAFLRSLITTRAPRPS